MPRLAVPYRLETVTQPIEQCGDTLRQHHAKARDPPAYARRTPVNSISPFIMSTKSFRYATGW